MTIFPKFFFRQYNLRKRLYDIPERNKPFLAYKNNKVKKSEMAIFSKGLTHGLCPKVTIFPTCFFLGNIGQENVFYDILERQKSQSRL